jgi:hypothetical protein
MTSSHMVRLLRANEILERIGSEEAKKVLEKIAAGDPAARETEDAKEALKRLERRGKAKQD